MVQFFEEPVLMKTPYMQKKKCLMFGLKSLGIALFLYALLFSAVDLSTLLVYSCNNVPGLSFCGVGYQKSFAVVLFTHHFLACCQKSMAPSLFLKPAVTTSPSAFVSSEVVGGTTQLKCLVVPTRARTLRVRAEIGGTAE